MTRLEASFVLPSRLLLLVGILIGSIGNSDAAVSSLRHVQPQERTNNVIISRELSGDNGTFVNSDPKIIGGTNVNSTALYPYFASTAYPSPYICGATLVAPDVLLTAAHCSVAFPVGVGAIVGTNKYRQVVPGSVYVNVTQQVIHPQYVNFLNYDLMLLKISPPVFSIRPIALQWNPNFPSPTTAKNMTIMGFGLTMDQVSSSIPATLQAASPVAEVPYTTCKSIWSPVTTSDICAESKVPLRVTCQGDSGGPLVAYTAKGMPIQVGTVSYGGVSCSAGPGVFTRLTSYENFLKGSVCAMTNYPPPDFQCVLIATDLPADGSGNATNTYAYSGGSNSSNKKKKKKKQQQQQKSTSNCLASGTTCRRNKQCCSGKCKKGACN